jgi:hypothetical protein
MVTALQSEQPRRVVVLEDEVRIDGFVETDPDVRRVLDGADDTEVATHIILRIGAQATLVAQTDLETQMVERRFEGMSQRFDTSLDCAVSQITEVSSKLLDEEGGALPRIFEDMKSGIGTILAETFDGDSKSSAIAKIESVVDGAVRRLDGTVRSAFDPDSPESVMGKTKREILDVVKEQGRELRKDIQEVATVLVANKARAEVVHLTAVKGFTYEEMLGDALSSIASIHGDLAEAVGTAPGAAGTKNGDHLVTINTEDTCGQEVRFVLECKDRKLGMAKTMEQITKAIENHSARAGIVVFSRQDLAPSPLPFSWSGNRAVLVYDKSQADPEALQLAYAWARWVCRRELSADGAALNVGQIEAALTRARQALQRHQAAKSCFSAATKKIDEGASHVAGLVDEVRSAMTDLWEELNRQ